MRIRGTFFNDYVKRVHELSHLDWDSYLTEEDWEIVRETVIPTQWYPGETMGHIGQGLFEMVSNGSYELVRAHGRARATDAYDEATKKFLIKGDPGSSIQAFVSIAGRLVEGVKVTLEDKGEGKALVCFHPVNGLPAWDLFREIQAGSLEALVELNGGKPAKAEISDEEREGGLATLIRLEWE